MRLEQFTQVLEIAKTGSLNKAAQNLFLSQPTLSQSLKSFEKEIGIRIFTRENKGMVLTEEGRQLIAIVEPLYSQLTMVPQLFSRKNEKERLIVNISNSFIKFVSNVYIEMVHEYSLDNLLSCYREVNAGEVLEDVALQRADIGVIYMMKETRDFMLKLFEYRGIDYYRLSGGGYWIIIGPQNPLYHQNRKFIATKELEKFPLVLYDEKYSPIPHSAEGDALYGNGTVIRVNNRASMLELVRMTSAVNIGVVSQLPYQYTKFYPDLKCIEMEGGREKQEYGWICRKNCQPNEPARFFLNRLIEITMGTKPVRLPMDYE